MKSGNVDHSKGELVMATNAEFEPYEYHDGDSIVGIDVDIATAICDKNGIQLKGRRYGIRFHPSVYRSGKG